MIETMKYENIAEGIFRKRLNRFVALVEIDGGIEICHVKNTGRCKELLIPGAKVILEIARNPARKTAYDLIQVWKGNRLINMDSQAPNKVVYELLQQGRLFPEPIIIKPETTFLHSRFDFYVETTDKKIFIEVKGVTLEEDGVARFPDAPTERGIKHLLELKESLQHGYEAYVIFVIQMKGISCFEPNRETHPAFAEALMDASKAGVQVLALDCKVETASMTIDAPVPVNLQPFL